LIIKNINFTIIEEKCNPDKLFLAILLIGYFQAMEQLLVDMDGVLANVYSQFLNLEFKETGVKQNIESLSGKIEADAFLNYERSVHSMNFFRKAPVIPDSIEGLKYLNNKYRVLIVSSAMEFPHSLIEKYEWLIEFYPFISWKQFVFCGEKASVKGDIMIDDHPKNLDFFTGRKILFTQPHNIHLSNNEYQRVDNWKQLIGIL
jgi:5'(3')-deoxyribonucleotidase